MVRGGASSWLGGGLAHSEGGGGGAGVAHGKGGGNLKFKFKIIILQKSRLDTGSEIKTHKKQQFTCL